jgi:GNAT superfamily N-acetyltransferase
MTDIFTDCEVVNLSTDELIFDFDCGDSDLNDFFNCDALNYQNQWLGCSYFFRHKKNEKIVCAFSLAADSVKTFLLPNSRKKKVKELIPYEKSLQSYPAFLIGRLGVDINYSGQGIGTQLLKYIKYHCADKYPNFGRFLVVDAYNDASVLSFYQKNDFSFVFSTEQQEKENLKRLPNDSISLNTRQMFFDLMRLL